MRPVAGAAVRRRAVFRDVVYSPAATEPAGLRRLNAICDAWIAYLADPPFPGGCFLTAMVEFDNRPGPVNAAVKRVMSQLIGVLERETSIAIENGELSQEIDPEDIALAVNALAVDANCHYQLHHDRRGLTRARDAMTRVLSAP